MHCPFCSHTDTKVLDSRLVNNGRQIKRRRKCENCDERFSTYESAELIMPKVRKKSGRLESFDEAKLISGLKLSIVNQMDLNSEDFSHIISDITEKIRTTNDREINTEQIGKIVLSTLKSHNEMAYLRFASVYLKFQSIDDFNKLIESLNINNKVEEI